MTRGPLAACGVRATTSAAAINAALISLATSGLIYVPIALMPTNPAGRRQEGKMVTKKKRTVGVGMPAALMLNEFGSQVWNAFGGPPYHVGSSLTGKSWRDVDVRLILDDEAYAAMGLGDPEQPHSNGKWVAFCLAFSMLGKHMTGLPIDFQIQQRTNANKMFKQVRSALGIVALRIKEPPHQPGSEKEGR